MKEPAITTIPLKPAKDQPFVAACEQAKRVHRNPPNDHRDIAFLTSGRGCFRKYRRGW